MGSFKEFLLNRLNVNVVNFFRWVHVSVLSMRVNFNTFLRQCGIGLGKYQKLSGLKNKFQGKRCFIIATGPSLTNEDILKLREEYTFSMNAMCLKYEELGWKPTFYGIQDKGVFEKVKKHIENSDVEYVFVDDIYRKVLPQNSNFYFFPRNPYYNAYNAYFKNKYKAKFSNNPAVIVYDGFTITCSLIQIAIFMGFKKIYLLGCDCNYNMQGAKYFVDHGHKADFLESAHDRMLAGYRAAKEYADNNGIKIYNATRGGMLEIFERVNLDEVLKN